MLNNQTAQKLNPDRLLKTLARDHKSGFLEIRSGLVCWKVYIENQQLLYVSYDIEGYPNLVVDRVKQQTQRLKLESAIAALENSHDFLKTLDKVNAPYYLDYPILLWLLFEHHLAPSQANVLARQLFNEAFEHLLCAHFGTYHMIHHHAPTLPGLYQTDLSSQIAAGQRQLLVWQTLSPTVQSIHQRPCLTDQVTFCHQHSPTAAQATLRKKLSPVLKKGYSFWQLASLLKCSEFKVARFLYPHILEGAIQLKAPVSPFNQLPNFCPSSSSAHLTKDTASDSKAAQLTPPSANAVDPLPRSYSIVCIDDSPSTLTQIERFLDKDIFLIFKFSEPVKAISQIKKISPDIIFLDIGMPKVNGYELCRMLRNHPSTKNIPIVIITGNQGVLNKSKAKSVGASDYITKPFTRSDLLEVVTKYLSNQVSDISKVISKPHPA
ncbi:MAG: response regulator [Cyanobacteria bacterium P01_A01_bin.114]